MPWGNDDQGANGGGPWGQGPWNQKPGPKKPAGGGGRGPTPPDLDELFKRATDTLKTSLPGGSGRRGTWLLPVLAVLAFVGFKSVYQIQPDEQGVVLKFGAYSRTTAPGLHFILWPAEKMEIVRTGAENKIPIGDGDEGLMLTGDQNMVEIKFNVLWRIVDPKKYLFNMADPPNVVRNVAESAMREIVGRTPATDAMTNGKLAIQQQVTEILQTTLDNYDAGIRVSGLTLEAVDAPPNVQDAFKEVQRAQQDQVKSENDALKYSNQQLREAEGKAAQIIQQAEAYKAQTVNEAKGEAQRFDLVYGQYVKAKNVTRERMFLETMESVLGSSSKVIIEQGKGGSGVVPYLPLPALQAPKAEGGQQ